jgi:cobalamin biosynthesis protein CobW
MPTTPGAVNETENRQIPALVVSGFLGSGKTTLVRWLLRQAQENGSRVAVVSNEFGELGIDRALLGEAQDAYVELEGGCVCCQLSNELRDTLQRLRIEARPDQVIVETSGVALPAETQLTFWRQPVSSWIAEDVAIVVVNALQVWEGRDLDGTFEDQVTSADLLLLNKIDLVPLGEIDTIEARLREMEPSAPIVRAAFAEIDPAVLFPPDADRLPRVRRPAAHVSATHGHERFIAREIRVEPSGDEGALVERLRALGALRVKGFVETAGGLRLVQGVGARVQLSRVTVPPPRELIGRVVVIERR